MKGGKEKDMPVVSLFLKFLSKPIRDDRKQFNKHWMEGKAEPGAENKVRGLAAGESFHMEANQGTARQSNDVGG